MRSTNCERGHPRSKTTMPPPIQLISTDFDGTFYAEFENPPVPADLQVLIGRLQQQGAKWVINTGRDLSSLMETLGRAHLSIHPDYLVVVEREIYAHEGARYAPLQPWNSECERTHRELFARVQPDLPELFDWVNGRFKASVYSDPYSPFCLIAGNNDDADVIEEFLTRYCARIPNLALVRNDVYARFSHEAYSKGTALAEIARQLGVSRDHILAAGDHWNDLPMLLPEHARWLVAPSNAIPSVKEAVRRQGGFVSDEPHGYGVARGIELVLKSSGAFADGLNSKR
jgi:hydroxymethylpyrimidine pyrophosphatase-like HAD family hydrolase